MINDLQVPDEFLGAFRRLVRRMPVEFQTDDAFLQTLMMYLKLGGEKLARHRIEVEKTEFVTAFTLVKRQPHAVTTDTESGDDDADGDADGDEGDAVSDSDEGEAADSDTIAS